MVNAQPITDRADRRLGAVAALHDVTEQRLAERFRTCELEVVKALSYAEDRQTAGRVVVDAVATTLGWPYGELWLVDDLASVLRPVATWAANQAGYSLARDELAAGAGIAGTVWQTGQRLWLPSLDAGVGSGVAEDAARHGLSSALALPVRGEESVQGVLVLFTATPDEPSEQAMALLAAMTAHVGTYLARQHVRGLAAELGRSRDDFLSLVGHAMRTPLTSIASYTDLLSQSSRLADEDRQLLEVVGRHTENLRGIIDDLLEVAALESGHLLIDRRRVDLVVLINAALERAQPAAARNGITLRTQVPDSLVLDGDPVRLARALDNLLSNAVKYSPDGGMVEVQARTAPGAAELIVTDSGVGIPPHERESLFQRFFRASNVLDRGISGNGLGLTTVRAVVEAHGGRVSLSDRSDGDAGTAVVVRLPLADTANDATDRPR